MKQIAIYVRQSQDKTGEAAAVDRQESACRMLAKAKGWPAPKLYADNDISASNGKARPGFERLVTDIEAGRVDAIIVWHLDRLTRSMRDLGRVIEAGQARSVNIAGVHGVSIDLGDPTGVAVASILTAIAAMEVQHKGQRQKAANKQRATEGKSHWIRRPYGYTKAAGGIAVVEDEAAALRDAARRLLEGATLAALVREWNAAGRLSTVGKPWNVTSLKRAVINPRTAGRRLYNGEDMGAGLWPAILDDDTFRRLEEKLTDPRRRTAPDDMNTKYLLSGIAICDACGSKMYASPMKNRKAGSERMVIRCMSGCLTRTMEPIEDLVQAYVIAMLSRPDAAALFTESGDLAGLRTRATELRGRRAALAAMLADGLLTAADVRQQAGKLVQELDAVQDRIRAAEGVHPAASLIGADDVTGRWLALPLATQKQILRALLNVTVLRAGKGIRFSADHIRITPKMD